MLLQNLLAIVKSFHIYIILYMSSIWAFQLGKPLKQNNTTFIHFYDLHILHNYEIPSYTISLVDPSEMNRFMDKRYQESETYLAQLWGILESETNFSRESNFAMSCTFHYSHCKKWLFRKNLRGCLVQLKHITVITTVLISRRECKTDCCDERNSKSSSLISDSLLCFFTCCFSQTK